MSESLITSLQRLQVRAEEAILSTPTGPLRNAWTELQISVMLAILAAEDIEKLSAGTKGQGDKPA